MFENDIFERTKRLHEQCMADVLELVQPVTESHAVPVNVSYTYEKASQLRELREEIVPYETIVAYLTSGKADTVRIGFELANFGHRIGTITLRYQDGKMTAEYDELIQQLLNRA